MGTRLPVDTYLSQSFRLSVKVDTSLLISKLQQRREQEHHHQPHHQHQLKYRKSPLLCMLCSGKTATAAATHAARNRPSGEENFLACICGGTKLGNVSNQPIRCGWLNWSAHTWLAQIVKQSAKRAGVRSTGLKKLQHKKLSDSDRLVGC